VVFPFVLVEIFAADLAVEVVLTDLWCMLSRQSTGLRGVGLDTATSR
jgi:hypothetical protein